MDLQFLGATDTVTGSKYLLGAAGRHLLVDCGLFQGYKQLRLRNWNPLPVASVDVEAIVLTHAHVDHSGYLPLLARQGFEGPVYCTPATRDLCELLLVDSGHLQEEEAQYLNEHGLSKHHPALPLYTRADAQRCLPLLRPVPFGRPFEPVPGLHCRFAPAGHLPGAASARIDDGITSILFSGDLGRPHDVLVRAPAAPEPADVLVVESTYGDRLHDRSDPSPQLAQLINRTAARGGIVLIPAFAVGRAQALMHLIEQLREQRAIAPVPVFLNSPMAAAATRIYHDHLDELRLTEAQCRAMARTVQVVATPEESRALNARHGPMIVIAASGMATGGRVVHHLKAFAPDHRNTILLTGYQAGGTRGASLAAGAASIRIHGNDVPVRAEVVTIDTLSAHADADEIVQWLRGLARPPRRTFVTHGEPAAADALRQRIERELGWDCGLPGYLEQVKLD